MKISAEAIDALLPQTQCGECGYAGCMPYAQALSAGLAPVNLCPPGGGKTLEALGVLLNVDVAPYREDIKLNTRAPSIAKIIEEECIGCTKCIQACPVDAIIGTGKWMHSIVPDACTGCGLCVEPCPVDCIEMVTVPSPQYDPNEARQRHQARLLRILQEEQDLQRSYREKRRLLPETTADVADRKAKQQYILAALARVNRKDGSYE